MTAAIYQIEEDNRAVERELVKPALMTGVQLPDSFGRYNSRTFAVLQTNFSSSFFPGEKSRRSCTRKLFLLLMTGGGGGGSEKELWWQWNERERKRKCLKPNRERKTERHARSHENKCQTRKLNGRRRRRRRHKTRQQHWLTGFPLSLHSLLSNHCCLSVHLFIHRIGCWVIGFGCSGREELVRATNTIRFQMRRQQQQQPFEFNFTASYFMRVVSSWTLPNCTADLQLLKL